MAIHYFLGGVESLAVSLHVGTKISYGALRDFAPIILLARTPSVVVVGMTCSIHGPAC